jgi:hypothetical protein
MFKLTKKRSRLLSLVAFGFFALAAIFAGVHGLHRSWPWLVPAGLAAWVLSEL